MAYYRRRYRTRKTTAKRRPYQRKYSRYHKRGKKMMKPSRSMIPGITLPDRMFVKLAFTYTKTFTFTASGDLQAYVYSGNNINHPGPTGSVDVPSGWSQWASLYTRWRVYSSAITAKFMSSQDPTLPSTMRVAVIPYDGELNPTADNIDDVISGKYCKFRVYNATTTFPTIKHAIGVAKINGVSREQIKDNEDYSAAFTEAPAGPATGFNWYIYAQPLASTTTTINVTVRVIYNVELYQRQELIQSVGPG